jgi:rubrerythrin
MPAEVSMELSSFQISKIELIADYEKTVMELYWVYSEKFPEHRTFWIDMADDERKNTEWVRSTIEQIKEGKIDYNRDRFNIEAIRTSMNFIKTQIKEALDQPVSMQTALANAAGIEDSMAKKKFYEIIKDDNPETRNLYQKFIIENQKHRDRLNQYRSKLK